MIWTIDEIAKQDMPSIGAKAYNLALSKKALKDYEQIYFPRSAAITCTELHEYACNDAMSNSLILDTIKDYFGNSKLIIRSSSCYEDSKFFSGAGQYETFMNLSKKEEIAVAINLVYRSAKTDTAKLYNNLYNFNDIVDRSMAVLIQEMIKCTCSGVLYTRNPINNYNEMLIEYSYKNGEKVASGEIDSVTYLLEGDRKSNFTKINDSSIVENMKHLTEAARVLEKCFNTPLDIEWGISEGMLYIFQARPLFHCDCNPWDADFTDELQKNSINGKIISSGLAIGMFAPNSLLQPDESEISKGIAAIVRCDGVVLSKGGLLSHFSSLTRELACPCILSKETFQKETYWIVNAYSGQIIPWSLLTDEQKGRYLWEGFYYIAKNVKHEVLERKKIVRTDVNTKLESVIFNIDVKVTKQNLLDIKCRNETIYQKSMTFDIDNEKLINYGFIIRMQKTDDYVRLQMKRCDYSNKRFRKDIEILIYFENVDAFNNFIAKYPLHITGNQERKRSSYFFNECVVNFIEWPNSKPYLGIEACNFENIREACIALGNNELELQCISGKGIFQQLELKLNLLGNR